MCSTVDLILNHLYFPACCAVAVALLGSRGCEKKNTSESVHLPDQLPGRNQTPEIWQLGCSESAHSAQYARYGLLGLREPVPDQCKGGETPENCADTSNSGARRRSAVESLPFQARMGQVHGCTARSTSAESTGKIQLEKLRDGLVSGGGNRRTSRCSAVEELARAACEAGVQVEVHPGRCDRGIFFP
jgi:hypothetical protein